MDYTGEIMVKKIKFGPEIFYGHSPDAVPYVQLSPLDDEIVASYTGPDSGLAYAEGHTDNSYYANFVAGVRDWNLREQQAYGISVSLYEQHPISGRISGEPIADSFALCARRNNTILMVADGVNWGEKSRLAARCALYGSMKFLNYKIFERKSKPENTQDLVRLLRKAVDEAHRAIICKNGGLTTLCICMICAVANSEQHAVCCINVGDSFGFIYSANQAIREITVGSHDVGSERDIRDAGGALGPVKGIDPELHNLTCSVTFCHKGDIVFLTSDGISDNFDPVVSKIAIPMKPIGSSIPNSTIQNVEDVDNRPELTPKERHIYALKEMERVVHEYELETEEGCTAQSFCGALLQHALTVTDQKRRIAENPANYAKKKISKLERHNQNSEIAQKMSKAPGKLDHASIVAVEVGAFLNLSADLNIKIANYSEIISKASERVVSKPMNISESPPTPTHNFLCGSIPLSPPHHHHKKSGAKKILSKLKSLPSSPTSSNPPPLSSSVPAQSYSCFSPPLQRSYSPPLSNSSTTQPSIIHSKSTSFGSHKEFDLHFVPPPKFPNRHFNRPNSAETPTSPTIMESPLEIAIRPSYLR